MAFDPNNLNFNDPLLMAILRALQNQGQQSNPNILQGADGTYRNIPPENPLPPAPDLWATQGEVGGRAYIAPPVQNQGPNPWAGMTPEELAYNMQVNYMRNQGGSAGMSDREALKNAQASGNQASLINQKYAYTDVLRQNALDKRASEEE